jgi:hypothetical protein
MKQIMLVLTIAVLGFSAAYAGEETVPASVKNALKAEFVHAQDVTWTQSAKFFKADFSLYGQEVTAFYSLKGDFLSVIRRLSLSELPLPLMRAFREKFAGHRVKEVCEQSADGSTTYYIRAENETTVTVLKSFYGNEWTVFDKKKKK